MWARGGQKVGQLRVPSGTSFVRSGESHEPTLGKLCGWNSLEVRALPWERGEPAEGREPGSKVCVREPLTRDGDAGKKSEEGCKTWLLQEDERLCRLSLTGCAGTR